MISGQPFAIATSNSRACRQERRRGYAIISSDTDSCPRTGDSSCAIVFAICRRINGRKSGISCGRGSSESGHELTTDPVSCQPKAASSVCYGDKIALKLHLFIVTIVAGMTLQLLNRPAN